MEEWHHGARNEGSVFDGSDHPAGEVGFEGVVVGVTGAGGFAGDFEHDTVMKENAGGVEDTIDSCLPERGTIGLWEEC